MSAPFLRSASRDRTDRAVRYPRLGLRVARTLGP